jgi:hypothetical protein
MLKKIELENNKKIEQNNKENEIKIIEIKKNFEEEKKKMEKK